MSFEENEESRFDRAQFKDCLADLNKIIQEVKTLKSSKTEDAKKKISEKRVQGSMIVVKLKKLNRLDKLRLHGLRETLQKEKLQADSNRLKLQNLIYEADHLKKEIHKCFSFKSEDEDIELVALEEFIEKAPDTVRSKEVLENDHSLRKARLGFELLQRKEYAKQCKDLEKEKEEVAQKTVEVKKNLDSIFPCLQEVLKSTRPIQQILNMPFEKEWEIQKLVRLLPQPLYMAYTKLVAYSEVIDKRLSVSIEGDEEEANIIELQRKQLKDENSDADESENEAEEKENDFDEGPSNHRKIKRRQSQIESLNQKREKLFNHHPLSVKFSVGMKDSKEVFSVILNYLPSLAFVTVQGNFNIDSNGSIAAADVITHERILSSLFVDDFGDLSPNQKTVFQLQSVQLNSNDLNQKLSDKKLGKPFKWAQRLCGICFTSKINIDESQKLCEETVPDLIRQIRRRLKARLDLYKQIKSLESGKVTTTSSVCRVSSILQLFVSLSFNDFAAEACTKRFIQEAVASENDVFYRAIITRGSAKLECYICIPSNFPTDSPLFAINLSWNDSRFNADTSSHIREIEGFINNMQVKNPKEILMQQLHRAMTSFDIFLETESSQHVQNPEFQQEKNFSRSFKRRERSRPYQHIQTGNLTSFTHI